MARYASGKIAHSICDICGLTCDYQDMKEMWDGNRTCPECWNKKEESLDPQKYIPKHADAEALRHPSDDEFDSVEENAHDDYIDAVNARP